MIIYKQGDVLEALRNGEVDVVVHQTNCQGVMGSGIARQIKQDFPQAYKIYKDLEKLAGLKLGQISCAEVPREKAGIGYIVNLNGQDTYVDRTKCNTNYAALGEGFRDVAETFEDNYVLAMPKIGAGLGGGDWRIIEAIIESAFPDRTIYVYTLEEPKKYSKRNDIG